MTDYEELAQMGIDVKGKIVIARYGQSWRGSNQKLHRNMAPSDASFIPIRKMTDIIREMYIRKELLKMNIGVQRGSVMDMVVYPGDPLTPGVGATAMQKDSLRIQDAPNLLKIPVLPISYHDAKPLLEALSGPVAPENWRGALPITYHVGPGKSMVHLELQFDWKMVPCYDVIAMVKGIRISG